MSSLSPGRSRPVPAGPWLGVLAGTSTVLLVATLAGTAMGGGTFPSPFADPQAIVDYFSENSGAVRFGGAMVLASAIPLGLLGAAAGARIAAVAPRAETAARTTALGGAGASVLLVLSGLLQWSLSRPEVVSSPSTLHAIHYLSFLTGGVAHVMFLGLLVVGIASAGLRFGLLPRPAAFLGLAIAAVAEISFVSLFVPDLSVLLPIARFPGLLWLVVVGFLLPRADTPPAPAERTAPARHA